MTDSVQIQCCRLCELLLSGKGCFDIVPTKQFYILNVCRSVASCFFWAFTPAMPKFAPSASQGLTRDGASETMSEFWAACWKACTNQSFLLLMTSGGIVFGVFQCWASSLTK